MAVFVSILLAVGTAQVGAAAVSEDEQIPALQVVLDRVREAVGYKALGSVAAGLEFHGRVVWGEHEANDKDLEDNGSSWRYHFAFVPDGRYRVCLSRGGLERTLPPQLSGYDGRHQWLMEIAGAHCPFSDSSVLLAHWIISGTWLSRVDDLAPRVVSEESTGDEIVLALRPRMEERDLEYWLVIDRRTWLPAAMSPARLLDKPDWEFQSYQREFDVHYPSVVVSHKRDRNSLALDGGLRLNFDRVSTWKPDELDSFTPPLPIVRAVFDRQSSNDLECRLTSSGHLLVKASIDDGPPQWFILDTGTSNLVLVSEQMTESELTTLVEYERNSQNPFMTGFVQCERLSIGPLQLDKPIMFSLSLSFVGDKMKDKDWVGIVGYDVFRRSVIVLDAAAPAVRVYDPATYADKDLNWQPIRFAMALPHVRCRMEGGKEGFFLIDTGNPGRVDLREEAIVDLGLDLEIKQSRKRRLNIDIQGVKAVTPSKSRLDRFEIGGHRLENVEIDVKPDKQEYAGLYRAGVIGLELLAKFVVVFDYPRERVAFVDRVNAELAYPDDRKH